MPKQIKDYQSGENGKDDILTTELGLIKKYCVKIISYVMTGGKEI